MSGTIHLDRHGPHVALIRIDRPEARNALTPRMLCALADAFVVCVTMRRCAPWC